MNNRYFIRAAKYFLYLCVLFVALYAILILLNYSSIDTFIAVFQSGRGWLMIAAFVVLPLLYPFFGFVNREVKADINTNREAILRAFSLNGYALDHEIDGTMVFRGATRMVKLRMLFEDKITVTPDDNYILISGPRKEVVKTEFRIKSFMI